MVQLLFVTLVCFGSCSHPTPPPPPSDTDTTSHAFVWTIDTLGDGNSSVLYDVAIVSENPPLVYAVGKIYKRDSRGGFDPEAYNLAKWNGIAWELLRVTVNFRGFIINPPLYGIQAFSANQVWLCGGMAIHGDGTSWTVHDVRLITGHDSLSLTRCWGSGPSRMYFVGLNGSLTSYDYGTWMKIETGTTLDIQDIWGSGSEILAVASNGFDSRIIAIFGTTVANISNSGLANDIKSIWFSSGKQYYVVGAGIHQKHFTSDPVWQLHPSGEVTSYYSDRVRGNGANDVFVVGSFFEVVHFNGSNWRNFRSEIPFADGAFGSLAVKGDLVVAGGLSGSRGVVLIGRRK